jgi:hypothetical protein
MWESCRANIPQYYSLPFLWLVFNFPSRRKSEVCTLYFHNRTNCDEFGAVAVMVSGYMHLEETLKCNNRFI